ncbi:hypothetical protein [Streptomyces capuensis]|uniref:hypothetical protein n=1 Tax=Streptomyces capuensis TaxID=1464056 RepID=UPI0004BFBFAB|nr:hypothetical protein [Streptomyces capuensis]
MIRDDRFLISRKAFAVDLSTLTGRQHPRGDRFAYSGAVNAAWFRRKDGDTRACLGSLGLWSHYLHEPIDLSDPLNVLRADLDGRYGGDCDGRWDSESYWGNGTLEQQEQHLAVLRPMLAKYPAIPDGYDGWWRF